MSISKEIRIGALVTISLIVLLVGFYLLKGANIFSGENNYYVFYSNVQGLQPSSPVQIKGLTVGRVAKIELVDGGKVLVTLAVKKKAVLTKGTVAKLYSLDLLGTKAVSLEIGNSIEVVNDEDTIGSTLDDGAIEAFSAEVTPLIQNLQQTVKFLDTSLNSVNDVLNASTRRSLQHSISGIEELSTNLAQFSKKLNGESNKIASIIDNTSSISDNLKKNNEHISEIITNTETISKKLSQAPLTETIEQLQKTIKELQGVAQKMNSKDGSAGMLMNDKGLYNNLTSSLKSLDELMADMKAHPHRYINVSVFGHRKN
jgi:phospholipid/cholesterol/gamma-HCH transport system substrate-binding protein